MRTVRTGLLLLETFALIVFLLTAPLSAEQGSATRQQESEWPLHGRTQDEQRFSPLASIHRRNVPQLGLAWSLPTGTTRGLEATPIVVDGVMYVTTTWSRVIALDAATGAEHWRYDPKVPGWKARHGCCDVVNRGVAVSKGRVYLGTFDGRLVALSAKTGEPIWEVRTTPLDQPYTITGAPRVVKGLILIGNGGAEFGVRGYVSAYDAETGALVWRFYTVPASKDGPHEHPELEQAAETWSKDSVWASGLGGTVWDSMAWDPELDLLYVGVGNSSIYHRETRSPGGGDNLFLASILALRPDTGRLVWHYQTTPGEQFDYTATQHLILAELEIGGRSRKVLMQAPKNGFFYVLDRATGELLSAEKYVSVSWATHVDLATGRPVERPEASWDDKDTVVVPSIAGGHNWHPMSYSPRTGFVYVPAIENSYPYYYDPDFAFEAVKFNTAEDLDRLALAVEGYEELALAVCSPTRLLAWDPVAAKKVWEVRRTTALPAGVLATAGDLVFQGAEQGRLAAYDARTGVRLWASQPGVRIMAPPISYALDGEQYVAVVAGAGGSAGGHFIRIDDTNEGRILVWKLGGKQERPAARPRPPRSVGAPRIELSQDEVARGRGIYYEYCVACHGVGVKSSGLYPDLRTAAPEVHDQWTDIVLGGVRQAKGMASFADALSISDAEAVHAYVIQRALAEPNLAQRLVGWASEHACIPASWLAD
ncbi:MAG: PQQ-dependent dehydrogenase, methanol/ethanol family [Deltaproteobacteria bacterium]|nr:PQQ-dependent dehydrogenase, methanol/ethanol family [Deltaproteobacteria bacterium]MBW2394770.1 PQQ-dependent dehydrogenase, methanol/ethanol family [Deltaproteobacteria bacterium]